MPPERWISSGYGDCVWPVHMPKATRNVDDASWRVRVNVTGIFGEITCWCHRHVTTSKPSLNSQQRKTLLTFIHSWNNIAAIGATMLRPRRFSFLTPEAIGQKSLMPYFVALTFSGELDLHLILIWVLGDAFWDELLFIHRFKLSKLMLGFHLDSLCSCDLCFMGLGYFDFSTSVQAEPAQEANLPSE